LALEGYVTREELSRFMEETLKIRPTAAHAAQQFRRRGLKALDKGGGGKTPRWVRGAAR
jgi:hypothetical protein